MANAERDPEVSQDILIHRQSQGWPGCLSDLFFVVSDGSNRAIGAGCNFESLLARLCQLHGTALIHKQTAAQVRFKTLDTPPERGHRDVQLARCGPVLQKIGQRKEGADEAPTRKAFGQLTGH